MSFKQQNMAGFSLLELAVLLTVTGLIMGVVLQYYTDYRRTWLIEENKGRMKQIAAAIEYHDDKSGFFPCPAPRGVPATDPAFGKSSCPSTLVLPVGTCAQGLCRVLTNTLKPVLIGGLPFKDLNMTVNLSMQDYLDTYQNQFTYAIIEEFTTPGYAEVPLFDRDASATIGDFNLAYDTSTSTVSVVPTYKGSYVLISHGANGVGAYNINGHRNPCVAGTAETTNCDDTDANFLRMPRRKNLDGTGNGLTGDIGDGELDYVGGSATGRGTVAGTAAMYDDFVEYYSGSRGGSNHWTKESATGLRSTKAGMVGIGTRTPEATLHVSGPSGADANVRSEQVHANDICDTNGTNCFDPDIIAGDGINCGASPMIGISQGQPECSSRGMLLGVTAQDCGPNRFVREIDASGTIICASYIP